MIGLGVVAIVLVIIVDVDDNVDVEVVAVVVVGSCTTISPNTAGFVISRYEYTPALVNWYENVALGDRRPVSKSTTSLLRCVV